LSCRRALVVPMRLVNARNGSYILYITRRRRRRRRRRTAGKGARVYYLRRRRRPYTRMRYGLRARAPARIGGGGVRTN